MDASVGGSHKLVMGKETNESGDLLPGTLGMLVLKALARGPRHGYAIAEWIQETSGDVLRVEEGALYPALHRLELKGLLSAEWGTSDNNRRAKYYGLTAAGRKQLATEAAQWRRLSGAIAQVMLAT
jgi:PadR family transcriptional regulator PadR